MPSKINLKFWPLVAIIAFAAFSRFLLLGVHNVSPIAALALFGGAYFANKKWAYAIPFMAMWLTDIILNNTLYAQYFDGFAWYGNIWVYVSFIGIVTLGQFLLKKVRPLPLFISAVAASILFFMVTNFGTWASGALYPKTFSGLMTCFAAGLPFFQNTLIGDLLCTGLLFGSFELLKVTFPKVVFHTV